MEECRYLQTFVTPSELGPNLKEIILKHKEKNLKEEIQGTMTSIIKIKDFNNTPLSRTNLTNIEGNVLVKIIYKLYKPGDKIIGDSFKNDIDKRVFVMSKDVICEIFNRDYVKSDKIAIFSVRMINIKRTPGCVYFIAEGILI